MRFFTKSKSDLHLNTAQTSMEFSQTPSPQIQEQQLQGELKGLTCYILIIFEFFKSYISCDRYI